MTDFTNLVPEVSAWKNRDASDVRAWIGCVGNVELAIGYSTVFWPTFVEFEDYVLTDGFTVECLRGWERQCGKDRRAIESVMNHVHIADIHRGDCEDVPKERFIYLGRILREIYAAKLAWQFPTRSFTVRFDDSDFPSVFDYQIVMFQNEAA